MRRFAVLGAAVLAMLASEGAWANDTSSELALGGLRFVNTDEIAIEREDLFLSPKEVRVRYEMRNLTEHPVTLHVAFPMPAVPVESPAGYMLFDEQGRQAGRALLEFPHWGRENFLDFQVKANGRYLAAYQEVKALLPDGSDITAKLRDIGGYDLILRPRMFSASGGSSLEDDIGPKILRELEDIGAVDPGSSKDKVGLANWRTLITYHWDITYKPGVTVVEHSYKPIYGSEHVYFGKSAEEWQVKSRQATIDKFCIPGSEVLRLEEALARQRRNGPASADDEYFWGSLYLGYVLTTGANWAGPIRHFHLDITTDEDHPGVEERNFMPVGTVELCSEFPLHRLASGHIEADVDNFIPTRDIHALLLRTK